MNEDENKWWQTLLFLVVGILVLTVIGTAIVFALAWIFGATPETVCKIVCAP
jgi:hypothetical protein